MAQTDSEIDLDETTDHKSKDFSKASGKDFEEALKKAQSWAKKYKTADEIPDALIPESYDFRNLDGFDFTNPLRD